MIYFIDSLAEREGFEPPIPFRVCRFSRPEPSTARPPLRSLPALSRLYVDQGDSKLIAGEAPMLLSVSTKKREYTAPALINRLDLLLALEFIGQCARSINLAQRLDHSRGVNRNAAILCAVVNEISRQRLNISVKNETY